jgi:hypothetical protein
MRVLCLVVFMREICGKTDVIKAAVLSCVVNACAFYVCFVDLTTLNADQIWLEVGTLFYGHPVDK